jgi:hypothetical protein
MVSGIDKIALAEQIEKEGAGTIGDAILGQITGSEAISDAILQEMLQNGPMMAYIRDSRAKAVTAVRDFAELDSTDAPGVRKAQAAVADYVRFLEWVVIHLKLGGQMEIAAEANYDDDSGPGGPIDGETAVSGDEGDYDAGSV